MRVAYDANNLLYISGYTTASDYPTDNPYQAACNSCSVSNIAPEGFLTRLQPAPGFGASPASVTFVDIPVGQKSDPKTVTLSNPTAKGLYLSQPKLSDTQDFAATSNCGGFLEPGQNCTITFTFTPQSSGALTATYSIADLDNQQNPVVIALSGNGSGQSSATLSPATVAFGTINVGATATMTATLQNPADSALPIQSSTVTGTGFTLDPTRLTKPEAIGDFCLRGSVRPVLTGGFAVTLAQVSTSSKDVERCRDACSGASSGTRITAAAQVAANSAGVRSSSAECGR